MAATAAANPAFSNFLNAVVVQIINPLILLLVAVAFVVFIWGVFQFIAHAGDETKRHEGQQAILWGLVGLVIMFGAYGIINIAATSFNLPNIQKNTTTTNTNTPIF
jgi:succinate dehydrogenase/fumarate reductase cytochrome b subunit